MTVIVTNCTARKRGSEAPLTLGPDLVGCSLVVTVSNWRSAIANCAGNRAAQDLYAGRSVAEARRASQSVNARLFFVSAGLGLIPADDPAPAYDLSPVQASGGLIDALSTHRSAPSDWWSCLTQNGLSRQIRESPNQLILIALPSTYLKMIGQDLAEVRAEDAVRLRIFTSPAGASELPVSLRSSAMPYDERLESIPAAGGTRADFPQRALRHFVETLRGDGASLDTGRALVEKALGHYDFRRTPDRTRLDDGQMKALILKRWDSCQGRSSHLLQAIRNEEMVACEQGRFRHLWREICQTSGSPMYSGALG
jgi:hypothetical protein